MGESVGGNVSVPPEDERVGVGDVVNVTDRDVEPVTVCDSKTEVLTSKVGEAAECSAVRDCEGVADAERTAWVDEVDGDNRDLVCDKLGLVIDNVREAEADAERPAVVVCDAVLVQDIDFVEDIKTVE